MKYIAGSIIMLASAIAIHSSPFMYAEALSLGMFWIGFGVICLGIAEDIVSFKKNRAKKE